MINGFQNQQKPISDNVSMSSGGSTFKTLVLGFRLEAYTLRFGILGEMNFQTLIVMD